MYKMRTKRTLVWSVISLLLCVVMLIGSTLAWFTDSVSSTQNKIKTGILKLDLLHKVGTDWVSLKDDPTHPISNYDNWEPGFTDLAVLKMDAMDSTLSFKYRMTISLDMTDPDQMMLADVIEVWMIEGDVLPASMGQVTENNGWRYAGLLSEVVQDTNGLNEGVYIPGGNNADTFTLVLHMKEDAGNEYQDKLLSNLYISMDATQYAHEEDAFGSEYDESVAYS